MMTKVFNKVIDWFTPEFDPRRGFVSELSECRRNLVGNYNAMDSAQSNINFLEKKIARLEHLVNYGVINTADGEVLRICDGSPEEQRSITLPKTGSNLSS